MTIRYFLDARTATNHFPGIGRYVSNLAEAMAAELADDELLVLLCDGSQPSQWSLPPASEQVQHLVTAVSPFTLAQQWVIPRLLRQHQAHVYHSPYYLMPYRPGVPTLLTVYDLIPQLFSAYFPTHTRLLSLFTTWLALHRADHLIAISMATQRDILTHHSVKPEHITAVPLAPDPRFTPQSATVIAKMRQEYNLPPEYVLYLGINKPHKNLVRLVEAWTAVQGQQTATPLLVIAGAWDGRYPEAKARAESLLPPEAIRFLGPVADADLPALYSGAHFFVFPSLYEGFGLPVIEAMACGTAVMTSDVSSLPEAAGDAALFFNPQDTADMAQQLRQFLNDPVLVAAHRQKSLAQAHLFTWQNTAVATLKLYRQFIQPAVRRTS